MDTRHAALLFEYNRWANKRTRDAVARATPDQFTREIGGSYGSLRHTVAHLIASEWVWLQRWKGTSPTAPPFPPVELTLENLASLWQPIEAETEAADLAAAAARRQPLVVPPRADRHAAAPARRRTDRDGPDRVLPGARPARLGSPCRRVRARAGCGRAKWFYRPLMMIQRDIGVDAASMQ